VGGAAHDDRAVRRLREEGRALEDAEAPTGAEKAVKRRPRLREKLVQPVSHRVPAPLLSELARRPQNRQHGRSDDFVVRERVIRTLGGVMAVGRQQANNQAGSSADAVGGRSNA
jgi:hypothetical protein